MGPIQLKMMTAAARRLECSTSGRPGVSSLSSRRGSHFFAQESQLRYPRAQRTVQCRAARAETSSLSLGADGARSATGTPRGGDKGGTAKPARERTADSERIKSERRARIQQEVVEALTRPVRQSTGRLPIFFPCCSYHRGPEANCVSQRIERYSNHSSILRT